MLKHHFMSHFLFFLLGLSHLWSAEAAFFFFYFPFKGKTSLRVSMFTVTGWILPPNGHIFPGGGFPWKGRLDSLHAATARRGAPALPGLVDKGRQNALADVCP